jgi:hypothetical protein
LVEREEYIAGCVDDGISPRLRELWRIRDELKLMRPRTQAQRTD